MTELERLAEVGSELEVELLRAGRRDAMPEASRRAILMGLGLLSAFPEPLGDAPRGDAPPSLPAPDPVVAEGAASLGGKVLSAKGILAIAGLGVVGALSTWAGLPKVSSDQPSPASSVRMVTLPERPAEEAPTEEHEQKLAPPEGARSERAHERAPRVRRAAAPKGDSLPLELEAIEAARGALTGGNAALALRLLDRYEARFPRPRLGAEATVLRIEAHVARGEHATAVRLGRAFLAREPQSPYAR